MFANFWAFCWCLQCHSRRFCLNIDEAFCSLLHSAKLNLSIVELTSAFNSLHVLIQTHLYNTWHSAMTIKFPKDSNDKAQTQSFSSLFINFRKLKSSQSVWSTFCVKSACSLFQRFLLSSSVRPCCSLLLNLFLQLYWLLNRPVYLSIQFYVSSSLYVTRFLAFRYELYPVSTYFGWTFKRFLFSTFSFRFNDASYQRIELRRHSSR